MTIFMKFGKLLSPEVGM